MQKRCNAIAKALELRLFCIKQTTCTLWRIDFNLFVPKSRAVFYTKQMAKSIQVFQPNTGHIYDNKCES